MKRKTPKAQSYHELLGLGIGIFQSGYHAVFERNRPVDLILWRLLTCHSGIVSLIGYQMFQQDSQFIKISFYERRQNNLSKFLYILAKQCRSHFNLTNFS